MKKINSKIKLWVGIALAVIVIAGGGYLVYKQTVSADTSVTYPSWLDPQVVQKATSVWTTEQKSWLNTCVTMGSTILATTTDQERSLVGSNAKSFIGSTGADSDMGGTHFYTDKFRISVAPSMFQIEPNGMEYKTKFKYMVSNPNSKPIYLQSAILRNSVWGIPADPKAFVQPEDQTAKINNGLALKLNPGEYVLAESPDMKLRKGTIYSTLFFATQIYSRNADDSVKWGGGGAQSVNCIADPFSFTSLGGQDMVRNEFPSWFDSQTVSNFNSVWTASQKYLLNYVIYNSFNKKVANTSVETSQIGSNAATFEASGFYTYYLDMPQWYREKYKISIAPLQFQSQADGNYLAKFRIGISNPGSSPIKVKNVWADLMFYQVGGTTATVSGSGRATFANGGELTLSSGQYFVADTNLMTIKPSSFYYLTIADALKRPDGSYDESGPSGHFDIPIPIPLSQLGVTSPVNSVVPTTTSTVNPSPTSTATASYSATPTSTPSLTPVPLPSETVTTSPGTTYQLHKGFNALGSNVPIDPDYLNALGLTLLKFDGPLNKWFQFPGDEKFQTLAFKGYYVYAPVAKSIALNQTMQLATTHQVDKGWNLLWTNQPKTQQNLLLTINGVAKPAQTWISEGKMYDRIFQISNDSATKSCEYFSILASTASPANCSADTAANISSLQPGKNFWVYIY